MCRETSGRLSFLFLPFLCLSVFLAALLGEAVPPTSKLALRLAHEIPLQHAGPLKAELAWIFENPVAAHPKWQDFVALMSVRPELAPRRREDHGLPVRRYQLQRIDLTAREVIRSRELAFRMKENVGVTLSADGKNLCTVADGRILVLDRNFSTVAEIESEHQMSELPLLRVKECKFFGDGKSVLLVFWPVRGPYFKVPGAFGVWNWLAERTIRLHVRHWIPTVTPLPGGSLFFVHLEPGWSFRFRIGVQTAPNDPGNVLWETHVRDYGNQRSLASKQYVFVGDAWLEWPSDVKQQTSFAGVRDANDPLVERKLPAPFDSYILSMKEKVRTWHWASGKKGPEFGWKGRTVHWPLALSSDERWLAARATDFNRLDDLGQFRWKENRFVIFDVNKPKRTLYVSESFSSEEAITGLAFAAEDSKLVVSTTRRLLIYDIQAAK